MKLITYKMRAECLIDVVRAQKKISMHEEVITTDGWGPDCIITFKSPWTLERMQAGLAKVVDGHVMLDTLALLDDYTGER